ncbi:helix-turn-helix transcriptional regulator [Paenibacillus barcinonensis]|uniref:DNA-binding Xre family transcriptional regulator n=1 Tax=Paenibacillus barcinonensis TaxID=198119 RepID=A0A2V4W0K8_PAEBA|nr:helix-turn-helix transcriptional regulator [Paenibacillus barcinonensis]PYE51655.1 DNA-binding Xre family transcriptional regulator [Paenibacillus barcinonensis]QKS56015.1 helix-turn-helix transcriptional regulator [Paenibacillus barcinonensis]
MVKIDIDKVLSRLGVSYNQLAVRSKIRPNTLTELKHNRAKQVSFETIDRILTTLNDIAIERELGVVFDIQDIMKYDYNKNEIK